MHRFHAMSFVAGVVVAAAAGILMGQQSAGVQQPSPPARYQMMMMDQKRILVLDHQTNHVTSVVFTDNGRAEATGKFDLDAAVHVKGGTKRGQPFD